MSVYVWAGAMERHFISIIMINCAFSSADGRERGPAWFGLPVGGVSAHTRREHR